MKIALLISFYIIQITIILLYWLIKKPENALHPWYIMLIMPFTYAGPITIIAWIIVITLVFQFA